MFLDSVTNSPIGPAIGDKSNLSFELGSTGDADGLFLDWKSPVACIRLRVFSFAINPEPSSVLFLENKSALISGLVSGNL